MEVIASMPRKFQGVQLTSIEYHDMVKFVRNDEHEGFTFKQMVTSIVTDPEYKEMNDRAKANLLFNTIHKWDRDVSTAFVYSDPDIAARLHERQTILNKRKGRLDVHQQTK